MSGIYSVEMKNATVVASGTLVIIHTASAIGTRGSSIRLLRAWASQVGTGTSAQLGITLAQKASAFGTYSSATPSPHVVGGVASAIVSGGAGAAGTCGVAAGTEGAGAVTDIIYDSFNNLNGWLWVPTPEERIVLVNDIAVILKLIGTPSVLSGWSAGITFDEVN